MQTKINWKMRAKQFLANSIFAKDMESANECLWPRCVNRVGLKKKLFCIKDAAHSISNHITFVSRTNNKFNTVKRFSIQALEK